MFLCLGIRVYFVLADIVIIFKNSEFLKHLNAKENN